MRAISITALLFTLASATAAVAAPNDIKIEHPWCRPSPPGAPTGAGYMLITNRGRTADRLTGGAAEIAERLEIHEMTMDGDVMRMRRLENGLEIAPGATAALKPGGFHIMFIRLKHPLKLGTQVPFTLDFARAGKVRVSCAVQTPPMPMSHGDMK